MKCNALVDLAIAYNSDFDPAAIIRTALRLTFQRDKARVVASGSRVMPYGNKIFRF